MRLRTRDGCRCHCDAKDGVSGISDGEKLKTKVEYDLEAPRMGSRIMIWLGHGFGWPLFSLSASEEGTCGRGDPRGKQI